MKRRAAYVKERFWRRSSIIEPKRQKHGILVTGRYCNMITLKYRIIYFLRKENVFSALLELQKLDNVSVDDLDVYKDKKIKQLLHKVLDDSPFYMRQGRVYRQLSELPIIDKKTLRDNIASLYSKDYDVAWRSTSGTTGSPLVFPKDKNATAYMDAMMYHAYSWHNIAIGDRQARLWGRPLKTTDRLVQSIKDLLLNRRRLSAFDMNDVNCLKFFRRLRWFKPKYFYAYANALFRFALFLERSGLDGKSLAIDTAICTGEVLFPYQREKIAEIFGCRVVNEYGSTENGIIGIECEFGRMHVVPTVHVEIFNPDNDGFGEILITELNGRSLPFIRYKLGDIGRLISGTCECKRPYALLEVREGRVDDYIACPDGRLVYDAILAYTLKDYAIQFKAYQDRVDNIKIYLVPSIPLSRDVEGQIKKTLIKYLGDKMTIDLIQVNEIPNETSGKFRYFVSTLDHYD